jgi:EAL domain-containing protein (putative c-di-GMP-specific phosphodiesterase class I)
VREADTVARLGGDEFTLVLPDIQRTRDLEIVAEKLLGSLRTPFAVAGQGLFISASVGMALYPEHGESVEELLRNADAAMYRAKELGRDTFSIYASEMGQSARQRLALESALRRALREEQLELHFQPILSCGGGELLGLEALARWSHPEHGMLPPREFIPLAEATGLIVPLGHWALRTACRQLRQWRDRGLAVPGVAVNLSGRHLRPSLVDQVREVLDQASLSPSHLSLEISEAVSMQRAQQILGTLGALRELGVSVSIDDFGTGFSSLGHLNRFPIDALKIDGSLIAGIEPGMDEAPIASAVIGLAHNLGLKVIAEGVETRAQLDFLQRRRCDAVQGHLFSPALPAEQCADYVRGRVRSAARST